LKVLSAEFVTSAAADGSGVPADGLPQIALAGRSNVGKSSLINALVRRTIARTSAAPGKTRLANIYRVELEGAGGPGRTGLYFVDLPGYGYARGGAGSAAELRAVAEAYFAARGSQLAVRDSKPAESGVGRTHANRESRTANRGARAALLLVDARHPGLDADLQAARWLGSLGIDVRIVATKIDKLSRSERARNLEAIVDSFETAVLPVSAASGEGMDELWRMIVKTGRDAEEGA
jgi:GTP-binding protein